MRDTPHLMNASSIIHFGDWSRAGFEYMAMKYFDRAQDQLRSEDGSQEEEVEIEHLEQVVRAQVEMHQECEAAS